MVCLLCHFEKVCLPLLKIYAMQTTDLRDDIDFGSGDIPRLFRQMFYPTLLGMLFTAMFIITDGIFVGRGLGSDALAAINIVAPIFMISTGIGLVFGMGGSVLASIHLANGKAKVARLCATQATIATTVVMALLNLVMLIWSRPLVQLLGASGDLEELCLEYWRGFLPFIIAFSLMHSMAFFIRVSGAPKFAMICTILASLINIVLDYALIFIFKCGLAGAAVATGVGTLVDVALMAWFLSQSRNTIHFERIKMSWKSMRMSMRNIWYICRLGSSSLLSECAMAMMFICGNYLFMEYMGKDGVAAFSICCYLLPMVFMLNTSVAQSAQPIISYNYGAGESGRAIEGLRVSLRWGVCAATAVIVISLVASHPIVGLFIPKGEAAHDIAANGLPLFAAGFLPFAVNIIVIGYYQSVERVARAMVATLLRGFIFMIISFVVLPKLFGNVGVWLAVPLAEVATMIYLGAAALIDKARITN